MLNMKNKKSRGFPDAAVVKENKKQKNEETRGFPGWHTCQYRSPREVVSISGQENTLEEEMAAHFSIFAGKSHGQRNLAGYSRWGCKELDPTEQLSTHIQT